MTSTNEDEDELAGMKSIMMMESKLECIDWWRKIVVRMRIHCQCEDTYIYISGLTESETKTNGNGMKLWACTSKWSSIWLEHGTSLHSNTVYYVYSFVSTCIRTVILLMLLEQMCFYFSRTALLFFNLSFFPYFFLFFGFVRCSVVSPSTWLDDNGNVA